MGCKKLSILAQETNHLENVLSVVSDRRDRITTIGAEVIAYDPVILSATDYYPFGMEMPGRSISSNSYRFGFNDERSVLSERKRMSGGHLVERTAKRLERTIIGEWGSQTHYDYGFRIYNPAIGKFLSVDPLTSKYPSWTPYAFAMNRVIDGVDLDGLEYSDAKSGKPKGPVSDEELVSSEDGYSEDYDVNGNGMTDIYLGEITVRAKRHSKSESSNDAGSSENSGDDSVPSDEENGDINTVGGHLATVGSISAAFTLKGVDRYLKKNPIMSNFREPWKESFAKSRLRYGPVNGAKNLKTLRAGLKVSSNSLTLAGIYFTRESFSAKGVGPNEAAYLIHRYKLDQSFNAAGFIRLEGAAISAGYNAGYLIEGISGGNIRYNWITGDFTPMLQTLREYDSMGIDLERKYLTHDWPIPVPDK